MYKKSPQVSPEPSTPASPSATEEVVKEGLEWVSSWVEPAVLRVVVSLTEVGGVLSDALDGETIEFNINSIFLGCFVIETKAKLNFQIFFLSHLVGNKNQAQKCRYPSSTLLS